MDDEDVSQLAQEVAKLRAQHSSGWSQQQVDILTQLGELIHGPYNKETRARIIETYYTLVDTIVWKEQ